MVVNKGVLRPLKNGSGLTVCKSKINNVSRGRCAHTYSKVFKFYQATIKKEPNITKDVKRIVSENSGTLEGLDFRLKSLSSLHEKLYSREEKIKIDDVRDIIRYTVIYPPDKLTNGTHAILDSFKKEGYTLKRLSNTWTEKDATYRGININLVNPDGQIFELQVHTSESFELKNGELHALYERKRKTNDDSPYAKRLDKKMAQLSAKLVRPDNIERLGNYGVL